MKTRNVFALALMSTLALGACNNEEINQIDDTTHALSIEVTTNGMKSRASVASAENITDLGLHVLAGDNSTKVNDAFQQFTKGSTWAPAGEQILYRSSYNGLNVYAFSPYTEGQSNKDAVTFTVPVNQTAIDYTSDFLVCKKVVTAGDLSQGGYKLTLDFTHALSQLNITLHAGTEFENPAFTEPKVEGTDIAFQYNFSTESSSVTGTVKVITPYESNAYAPESRNIKYSCIVAPQTVSDGFAVSFNVNGKAYKWTSTKSVTFAANTNYNLTLNVGKDKVELAPAGITSEAWGDGGSKDITTD